MSIKIVITDDHPMVRAGISAMLSTHSEIETLAQFENGTQLLSGLASIKPDVILLDLQLPDMNGDHLIPIIKERYPLIKILILTSNNNIHNIKLLLNKGADGYLLKNTEQDFLIEAIQKAFSSDEHILSDEVKSSLKKLAAKSKQLNNAQQLTPREQEVLQLIAKELTSQEIGEQLHLSQRTVESYRLILMQKLDVKNMVGMVKKAIMLGLIKE